MPLRLLSNPPRESSSLRGSLAGERECASSVRPASAKQTVVAKIQVPKQLIEHLGPEPKMDVCWVDVKLRDGRILRNLVVRGRGYITGRAGDPAGEGPLDFESEDVLALRPHSVLFGRRWRYAKS